MQTGAIGRAAVSVARNRRLLRLESAYALFATYEMGVWVAILLWAYAAGGARFAGGVAIAQYIPAALLAPVGGVIASHLPRDMVLRGGYLLQALTIGVLALLMALDVNRFVTASVAVLTAITIAWTRPPHYAAAAELSESPADAAAANSLSGTLERAGYFVGPVLAGISTTLASPTFAVAGSAFLALVSAVLMDELHLGAPAATDAVGKSPDEPQPHFLRQLVRRPAIGIVLLIVGAAFLAEGCLELLAIAFVNQVLGTSSGSSGVLIGAEGLGGFVGAIITVVLIRWRKLSAPVVCSLAACVLPLLVFQVATNFVVAVGLLILVGIGMGFFAVAGITLLQRAVDDSLMTRILSLRESALLAGMAIGAGIAPFLIHRFGAAQSYTVLGALLAVTAVVAIPAVRRLDGEAVYRPELLALLASVDFLGVLGTEVIERLAHGARELLVAPGDVVIREGDIGDSYYLVESGELRVTVNGAADSVTINSGEGFGIIALIRRVPRTATVRAVTQCRLWQIEQDLFVAAVSGSTGQDLAERHIDSHLRRLSRNGSSSND